LPTGRQNKAVDHFNNGGARVWDHQKGIGRKERKAGLGMNKKRRTSLNAGKRA